MRLGIAVSDMVKGYEPADWDRAFRIGKRMGYEHHAFRYHKLPTRTGLAAFGFLARFAAQSWRLRGDRFVQLHESAYGYQ